MNGGRITIQKRVAGSLVVNITRTDAVAVTVKNTNGDTVSMPDTITANKTYVVPANTNYTISVKRNDVEIANTPDGTRAVDIEGGKTFTFAPGFDDSNLAGVAEIAEVVTAANTAAGWIGIPTVELDESDLPVDGPTGEVVLAWDAETSTLIYWDGTAWSTVAIVTP